MLVQADAFHLPFPDGYFHTCVTSPPYWGLRKYAGEQSITTGGDQNCDHEFDARKYYTMRGAEVSGVEAFSEAGEANAQRLKDSRWNEDATCLKCGAYRAPLGLEATPQRHIERMVEICREVWRVTRPDGVVWLNYGDCFSAASTHKGGNKKGPLDSKASTKDYRGTYDHIGDNTPAGNLMLMPHRLAIALQDDGWIVRNDLVWFKRNPMPESVAGWRWERRRTKTKEGNTSVDQLDREEGKASWTVFSGKGTRRKDLDNPEYEYGDDYVLRKSSWRHTRAHEYIFQLVKKMGYYCNQETVREPHETAHKDKRLSPQAHAQVIGTSIHDHSDDEVKGQSQSSRPRGNPGGRNPRSVMDVPTAPYKGAHYATFPPNLIAPLIRASVPRRCCAECGMAWAPVVEKGFDPQDDVSLSKGIRGHDGQKPMDESSDWQGYPRGHSQSSVTDYRPTCEHDAEPVPGRVLDIFGGSGTTGMVARGLMRNWVVMDISRPYLDEQAKIRTRTGSPAGALDDLPLFSDL